MESPLRSAVPVLPTIFRRDLLVLNVKFYVNFMASSYNNTTTIICRHVHEQLSVSVYEYLHICVRICIYIIKVYVCMCICVLLVCVHVRAYAYRYIVSMRLCVYEYGTMRS